MSTTRATTRRTGRPTILPTTRRGFTLVESIAAIVVLGTLGSLTAGLILSAADAYRGGASQARLHADLASALDPVERTLRSIPINAGRTGPSITQTTSTSIQWTTSSGAASLSLSGGSLMFSPGGTAAAPILTGVSALSVQTFDESNAQLGASLSGAATAPIRRIALTITASRDGRSDTLRTRVFVRCMAVGTP